MAIGYSRDRMFQFEMPKNQKGVWIRHLKEGRELYLFPEDIADLIVFLIRQER